mmetsp:Transcript_2296/g.4908  ORF Transcript_2296/g.4908 Transcript_2296/m.4908 type:complete len:98 (+) Transcript_2296:65-358(+)
MILHSSDLVIGSFSAVGELVSVPTTQVTPRKIPKTSKNFVNFILLLKLRTEYNLIIRIKIESIKVYKFDDHQDYACIVVTNKSKTLCSSNSQKSINC